MTPPNSSLSVDALLALVGELQARNLMLEQQCRVGRVLFNPPLRAKTAG